MGHWRLRPGSGFLQLVGLGGYLRKNRGGYGNGPERLLPRRRRLRIAAALEKRRAGVRGATPGTRTSAPGRAAPAGIRAGARSAAPDVRAATRTAAAGGTSAATNSSRVHHRVVR